MTLFLITLFLLTTSSEGTFFGCCGCPPPFRGSCPTGPVGGGYQNQPVQTGYPGAGTVPAQINQPVVIPQTANYVTPNLKYLVPGYYEEPEIIVIIQKLAPVTIPPPKDSCYVNSSGFRCCNTDLEGTMHGAYSDLKKSPDFNECNIGLMSKVVQKAAQRRFRLSFETIVSLKPFGSNSAYEGNYTCRFERDGKHFMSYATPVQYDVTNANSEDTLSNTDATHDDENVAGDGIIEDISEKQEKVDKLNAGLKDVKSTGIELHERIRRAIEMDHENYFIQGNEFIAFNKLNDTGRENRFITHSITMGSFNPSLTRMKLTKYKFC